MNLPALANLFLLNKSTPNKPLRVWGIDLGTTNSTVAEIVWSPEVGLQTLPQCKCLDLDQPTTDGIFTGPLVPSVVAILPSGGHWVGEGAKRLRTRPQEASLVVEKTLFFETKNDMGLRKTYYRAPETYNHASKIGGHVLAFLSQAAEQVPGARPDRIVVTVPASFQLNQRRDTLIAAQLAGLTLKDHDLLDEPTAALIDYLISNPEEGLMASDRPSKVLVFDFGGGTCDVCIVEIQPDQRAGQIRISPLAISRYHRLGGGDLDAAIVHEHLIPALLKENNLSANDLTWAEKKKGLEPQMLGTAEALKVALCSEIDRLRKFGKYATADKSSIRAKNLPLRCILTGPRREFVLSQPSLSAQQWEEILSPFLDIDQVFARETEYRLTQSVFAPLQDALQRGGLKPREIDLCLLVGGSTLIPQVRDAVSRYFSGARVRSFSDELSAQLAVARGAAWHAFYLALTGKPLVQPIVGDTIALLTGEGEYPLIRIGTPIPYPEDGSYARLETLAVPKPMIRQLKMEVIAQSTKQPLFQEDWNLDAVVNRGDPITLEYRLTSMQELQCRAYLTGRPDSIFERSIQNPLCNVVNPQQVRIKIETIEEGLRGKGGGSADDRDDFLALARCYAELNQHEKAIDILRSLLRLLNRPDLTALHLQGMYYGQLRDYDREEKAYREADKCRGSNGASMFNLSLSLHQRKKFDEALDAIEQAVVKESASAPYQTQLGICLQSLGRSDEAQRELHNAFRAFGEPEKLSDEWELFWLAVCADKLGDAGVKQRASEQRDRLRKKGRSAISDSDVERPRLRGDIQGPIS